MAGVARWYRTVETPERAAGWVWSGAVELGEAVSSPRDPSAMAPAPAGPAASLSAKTGRIWFRLGLRGDLAQTLQQGLIDQAAQGSLGNHPALPTGFADGVFGRDTEQAVRALQRHQGWTVNGGIDDAVWQRLSGQPSPPGLFERCLGLTAAFVGHDYTEAAGDFDGAGLTWGIVGFTLKSGSLQQVIDRIDADAPDLIQQTMGPLGEELRQVLGMTDAPWPASRLRFPRDRPAARDCLAKPWRHHAVRHSARRRRPATACLRPGLRGPRVDAGPA